MSQTGYLWEQVVKNLKQEIVRKNLKWGNRFYSLNEICQKYSVSLITAKRVFAELDQEGLIRRVRKKGTFIAKVNLPLSVYLVLPEGHSFSSFYYFTFEIYRGISAAVKEAGLQLQTSTSIPFSNNVKKSCFLLMGRPEEKNLKKLAKENFVVRLHSFEPEKICTSIRLDLKKGAYISVQYLLSLGHRRIGFISNLVSDPWVVPRFEGYQKALQSKGIKLDWELVKETHSLRSAMTFQSVEEILSLKNPATAIFATNDTRAIHILEYCYQKRIKVPEEVSVVGFDNVPESAVSTPPLTTVEIHLFQLGYKAVHVALDLFNNGKKETQDILIKPDLVIRKSTAPPLPQRK